MDIERISTGSINVDNVLRYMGMRPQAAERPLLDEIARAKRLFSSQVDGIVCYEVYPVDRINDFEVVMGGFCFRSASLAKHLEGCNKVIMMAATLGPEADRLRMRASAGSPLLELINDALGTEGIESVCDLFCNIKEQKYGELTPRYSPGYGDLSLEYQKDILDILDANRRIGVSLLDSLLMTPTKSVTAFVGVRHKLYKES